MNPSDHEQQLERLINRTLHDLPPRRAPRSLEARVLAELQRRAALPWWRKSFAHWPLAARAAFIVLSSTGAAACVGALIWLAGGINLQPLQDAFRLHFGWVGSVRTVFAAITSFVEIMLRNIPPLLLWGVAGVIGATYLALFGLGAAAYRALRPQSARLISAS